MLVNPQQIIVNAQKGKYAIGCFNTSDLEMTKAIIRAAEVSNSPVIIATSEKAIEYAGLEPLSALIVQEAKSTKVPVALHLDHGHSIAIIERCINAGYTSVMFDGSGSELRENEILTRHAVELAHHAGIPCEGELGCLGKAGVNPSKLTDPSDVVDFIQKTDVDFLAISIGSQHGIGEDEKLNISLLKKIGKLTTIPLVLHGASGVKENDIQEAIKNGIAKINIDTDIRHTYSESLRSILKKYPEEEDPREILTKVIGEVQKLVEDKIKLFGSSNKA